MKKLMPPPIQDSRCGTYAGFVAHSKRHEAKCESCRLAGNAYRRSLAIPRNREPLIRQKCGSSAGYKAHEKNGEKTCDPCRVAINEKVRLRNQKVADIRAQKSRESSANNLHHVRQVELEHRLRNPEKIRAKDMKRLARKKGAGVLEFFTPMEVVEKYGAFCHICNEPINLTLPRHAKDNKWGLHIDHVIALANGGTHTLDNVRPAHGFCNLSKGDR